MRSILSLSGQKMFLLTVRILSIRKQRNISTIYLISAFPLTMKFDP